MSGVEGSSLPPAELRLPSPHHRAPQILRPAAHRHFPFSPAPRPSSPAPSFDTHLLPGRSPGPADKDRIADVDARQPAVAGRGRRRGSPSLSLSSFLSSLLPSSTFLPFLLLPLHPVFL